MGLPPPVNLTPEIVDENDPENQDGVSRETETVETPDVVEPKKRGRGRPPSSGPRKTPAKKAADAKTLGRQIVGIHQIAAMATGLPELAIQEAEGERLAEAIQAVAEEYGLNFSGKTGAAIQLFAAAGMVYGPRALMIKGRLDRERKAEAARLTDQNENGNPGN